MRIGQQCFPFGFLWRYTDLYFSALEQACGHLLSQLCSEGSMWQGINLSLDIAADRFIK